MSLVPKKIFFTKGKGFHRSKLASFEQALRDSGIEKYNIVKVSSIFPPYCIEVDKKEGLKEDLLSFSIYNVKINQFFKILEFIFLISVIKA